MAMKSNRSVSEIDDMIRIYSDKIFELQERRAKLTGRTPYRLGAAKTISRTAYDKLQIEIASREIETELLAKVTIHLSRTTRWDFFRALLLGPCIN